ncbi:MAG: polysaccharide biosynthesis/export family protein [Flavobacteriales bacterium]|nr:polysaccharide biosynthesis/export family protein [Flavobacteriales bacterium]
MRSIANSISAVVLFCALSFCTTQQLLTSSEPGNIYDLLPNDTIYQHVLRTDDKLSLSIWNHNNLSIGSVFSIYNSNESFGKWVLIDGNGNAQLPKLGEVRLAGMTCTEAADTLMQLYSTHIKDPIIVAKVLNRHATVLGEVRTPGYFILEEEEVNLMDLIGKAEGFSDYADLSDVRLIRNNKSYYIDLQEIDEFFYHSIVIHSDDIVVVSSKKGKALDQKAPTLIPFASALTAIAVFATLIVD